MPGAQTFEVVPIASDVRSIDTIGKTALAVAALRAAEHRRADALFSDPYAERFVAAAGEALGRRELADDFADVMRDQAVVRTRFFDDHLGAATERGCRQVVLLASGMDSRPWRLAWPRGTTVFDVDQEPVLRFKESVLEDGGHPVAAARRAVAVDLRGDWAADLRAAGFLPERPTAWLVEGLLYSLDEEAAGGLLAVVAELSAAGSSLAFDHFEVGPSLRAATDRIDPGLTRLWRTGPKDPVAWLRRHGWRPEVRELADVAARYGRTPHPAYGAGPEAEGRSWLATATRSHRTG